MNMNKLLKARIAKKSKKPRFLRQQARIFPGLGLKWRSPKGNQSKLRMHHKHRGFIPHPGYGSPIGVRGLHPSGLEEVLVCNLNDMINIDPQKQALRISSTVGKKKRIEIQKKAEEINVRVLNLKKFESVKEGVK